MDMITKNERALLYLLSRTSHLTRMKLVKMMFLISKEQSLYDFVPYQYGPFSFKLYQDLRHLEREGHLTQVDDEVKYCDRIFPQPDSFIRTAIDSCIDRFGSCHEKDLIDYVYRAHPEMTIFSTIKRLEKYNRDETGIVTIGYEGRNIDRFLSLLIENKVGKLIDVRKNPFSMKYGFSKNQLSGALEKLGISYLHFPDLGNDSYKRQNLTNAGYTSLFLHYAQELEEKQDHLARIISLSKIEKVALMCFEAQASDCHRGVIAQRFRDEGLCVTDL